MSSFVLHLTVLSGARKDGRDVRKKAILRSKLGDFEKSGADARIRTADLLITSELLYH
jgi:hypothetical protein